MLALIETDILLAIISAEDKHHDEAIRLLDSLRGGVSLCPYSLIELDLLLRSGEIVVTDTEAFYEGLGNLLDFREISTLPVKPRYHGKAFRLRERYENLTYFDSLHAAVATVEDLELLSYDREYGKVIGLNHRHPGKYFSRK
jgi:predicted nucleic acid-binding protein